MLRFAEEILLLFLNEETGDLTHIPEPRLHLVLAGATLMDLALEGRLDTDPTRLTLLDETPLNDSLLDPALASIAETYDPERPRDASYWIQRTARLGSETRAEAVRRLAEAGILESVEHDFLFLVSGVRQSRRYPARGGMKAVEDVRLRVMRALFTDDIPDPRDIVTISLTDACGQFERLLSRAELEKVRPRIDLLSRMDLIGREVAGAIRERRAKDDEPTAGPRAVEIPTVKGLPLLGSALELQNDLIGFRTRGYLKHGPVFSFKALNQEFTVLAGPEANEFVARNGKTCLSTHWSWREFTGEQRARRDVISTDGPEHIRLRRTIRWGYSKGIYERKMATGLAITRNVLKDAASGRPVAAHRMLQRMVVEQIGMIVTGFNASDYVDDLVEYLDIMLATRVARQRPKFLYARRLRKVSRRVDELFNEIFAIRRKKRRAEGRERDLIDDILALHFEDPQFLPESDFRVFFIAPFLAGIDTAAGTAAFMLYALLRYPGLLEKMRAEVDPVFDQGVPTAKDFRRMDVTHRVAMETLRRFPLGAVMMRTVVNSFEFAGYRIPFGTDLIVGSAVTHFLPDFFPDPYEFDIDRYIPERAEHRQKYKYAPFGLGEHTCLGRGLAESMIALMIATIVRDTDPAFADPKYKLRTRSIPTLRPDSKFLIRFPPRGS